MNRPYIICHMETSINAKIYGPYMDIPSREIHTLNYNHTHLELKSEAWLCGRVTMEYFSGNGQPEFNPNTPIYPKEDFVAETDLKDFVIVVDASGKLPWKTNSIQYSVRPESHIIVILADDVNEQYVAYLRERNISFIFAGDREALNFHLAVQKLQQLFNINTLVVSGGAIVNGAFMNAGLIDEVSFVMAPVLDDAIGIPTLFERSPNLVSRPPIEFSLKSVEKLDGDNLWVRYLTKR
ncbi:RibD family protein [Wohlfahrtiimonas larvae]|uniref:RibD family protein n=1 Tax=Wohlfahrtiimonas larvae TaxID=1157986 RepID=A0ABP9MQ00_9GAMM|nr:dihydrofolate reductase family protein [Wohlfahrtiimonas larvae]